MAVIKYKDANGNWQTVVGVVIQNEVVQETGNSETAVMSQKAVSKELDDKLSLSGGTISGSLKVLGLEIEHTNEINSHDNSDDNIHLNFRSSGMVTMCLGGGNCGIGNTSPSYRLDVTGAVGATAFTNTSDIRKKDVIEDVNLSVSDIANAPLFKFTWIDPEMPEGVNVGTSAQYWKTILPELISESNDNEKTLSMQYGVAALASSISLAKKVVEQEDRIKALEEAIKELQNKLK